MVKAKFKLVATENSLQKRQIDQTKGWDKENLKEVEMKTLIFDPIYHNNDPKHENSKFWNATPSGHIRLGTVNPEAWQYFVIGQEYYVTFEAVGKSKTASG